MPLHRAQRWMTPGFQSPARDHSRPQKREESKEE